MFTLEEVTKAWEHAYSQLDNEFPYTSKKFFKRLRKIQLHKDLVEETKIDKVKKRIGERLDVLWEFISEKDIPAIMQKLKEIQ